MVYGYRAEGLGSSAVYCFAGGLESRSIKSVFGVWLGGAGHERPIRGIGTATKGKAPVTKTAKGAIAGCFTFGL